MHAEDRSWMRNESGSVAVEYGLVLSLVSIAAIMSLQALGLSLIEILERVQQALDSVHLGLR